MVAEALSTRPGSEQATLGFAISTAAATGIIIWDYLNLLPEELKLYTTSDRRLWSRPEVYAFLVLRYGAFVAAIPALFFACIPTNHCTAAGILALIGSFLVTASAGMLFACRVFAMWNRNRVIYGVVGLFYFTMVGCWIASCTQLKVVNGPPVSFGSNCVELPIRARWIPVNFVSSLVFDSVILAATLVKLRETSSSTSSLGSLIYRDTLLYFIITAAANFAIVVINSVPSSSMPLRGSVIPINTVFTTAMGSRTFLNLRLFKPQGEGSRTTDQPRTFTFPTGLEEDTFQFYSSKGRRTILIANSRSEQNTRTSP